MQRRKCIQSPELIYPWVMLKDRARCEEPGEGEGVNPRQCPGWCSVGLAGGVQEAAGKGTGQGSKEGEVSWKEVGDNGQEGVQEKGQGKGRHAAALKECPPAGGVG